MKRLIFILLSHCALAMSGLAQGNPLPSSDKPAKPDVVVISTDDLQSISSSLGKRSVVRGKILNTGKSKSGINFLNFRNEKFVALCFPEDLVYFKTGEPAKLYKDKTVEISGVVSKYKDIFQIKVFSPDQVKIVATTPEDEGNPEESNLREGKGAEGKSKAKSKAVTKGDEPDRKDPEKTEKGDAPIDPDKFFDDE